MGDSIIILKVIKLTNSLDSTIDLFKEILQSSSNGKASEWFVKPVFCDLSEIFIRARYNCQFIPLIFCDSYEKLLSDGVSCPREFVIERKDFYYNEIDGKIVSGISLLKKRLNYFCDHDFDVKVDNETLKDWFAGLFRRYCYQDEHVHGSSNLLNLSAEGQEAIDTCNYWFNEQINTQNSEKIKPKKEDILIFLKRFGISSNTMPDPLSPYYNFLNDFYSSEIQSISDTIKKFNSNPSPNVNDCLFYLKSIKDTLHDAKCLDFRFNAPTLKFNVLVLDDEYKDDDTNNKVRKKLETNKNQSQILNFVFKEIKPKIGDCFLHAIDFKDCIVDILNKIKETNESYDLVLLDLSLKEKAGGDLMGYHAINLLHQFLPQMPIIIYSQFNDMGHIARAFRCGAKWFLKKGEEEKLPRHARSVMKRMEWKREWQSLSNGSWDWESEKLETECQKNFAKCFKSNEEWQYLTYKCLEKYPGKKVVVCPMEGGFSTTKTFRAVKGYDESIGKSLQTPVIIKIDNVFNTRLEYERYFRFIRPYIANQSGRIEEPERVLDDDNAAIVYTFAGRQHDRYKLTSMKEMLRRDIKNRSSCRYETYEKAFDIILNEILPRIHAVDPKKEFDNVDCSDFPNRSFGEVNIDHDITRENYLANWLYRMPIIRKIDNAELQEKSENQYEFFKKGFVDGEGTIEALDFNDKCRIIMAGPNIDHVVKYRPHTYPCMTLYTRSKAADNLVLEDSIPQSVSKAIHSLYIDKYNEFSEVIDASNEFSTILKKLLNIHLSAGKSKDTFFKLHNTEGSLKKYWEEAISKIENKRETSFNAIPSLFKVAKSLLDGKFLEKLKKCPAGIIHGDLNYANIMLETRKRLSDNNVFTDDIPDIKDVWFIDFARTRRDLIAHDFNVLFTSTLGLLFDKEVWQSEETIAHDIIYQFENRFRGENVRVDDTFNYSRYIETIFRTFIVKAVFDPLDAVPDGMDHDKRLSMIFRILRRIRSAALKAGMSEESYAFTTALSCLVASRVYIKYEKNAPAAAAMIATSFICLAKLIKIEVES